MFPFAAIAGAALPALVGGLFGKSDADRARDAQKKQNKMVMQDTAATNAQNRAYQLADRANERAYAADMTAEDRAYAARMTADDRAYAARLTAGDRAYSMERTLEERDYAASLTADDRAYAAKLSRKDRENFLRDKRNDRAMFKADRKRMQKQSNKREVVQAESRSLDFAQLRDDAIAAGFNPLTALQFATSYSREVDYHDVSGPYQSMAQTPTSASAGGSIYGQPTGSGSSAYAPQQRGSTFAAPAAASSVSIAGSGYTQTPPTFASADFVRDAVAGGVDTYFNAQDAAAAADDARYEAIANRVAVGQYMRELESSMPRNFGFDMTKVRPYRPSVDYGDGSGLDPVHGRPVEVNPVMNIPASGIYDLGGGQAVRGLSQDVEWSELAQMGSEAWLGANYATRKMGGVWPGAASWWERQKTRSAAPELAARSYALTGSRPVSSYLAPRRVGSW